MDGGFQRWMLLSFWGFVAGLAATWEWFNPDEFVNIMQARRANAGFALYTETAMNHPPFYVEPFLRLIVLIPGSDLVAARSASLLMTWGAGVLLADLWMKSGRPDHARTFLILWTLNGFLLISGTRAMNEVPLLFLIVFGFWSLVRFGSWAGAGGAMALAGLTRLSAAFYVPALLAYAPRRAPWVAGMAAGVVGVFAALYALVRPEVFASLLENVLFFHFERLEEQFVRKLLKLVWWSGLPVLGFLAWRMPELRRRDHPVKVAAFAVLIGLAFMLVLPTVHTHYLLASAPILVGALTFAYRAAVPIFPNARTAIVALALLVPASQGVVDLVLTPHNDLNEAKVVAEWVQENTPGELPILTDAPQYALLAKRDNFDGYYWAQKEVADPGDLVGALGATSVVVVSERWGEFDDGFPPEFLMALEPVPCRAFEGALVYWTGAAGPAHGDFVAGCAG